jgi:asparagine synthase (glutamine-hydrolysing)
MRLLCVWGSAGAAVGAASYPDSRDSETKSKSRIATLRSGNPDCGLTLHFSEDVSRPTRVWQHPGGSVIAVDGEIFGEGDAIGRPIPLSGLLDQLTRSPQSTLAALNSSATILTWDARTQELCVARDRYGVSHVFYARSGNGMIISSDIQSILAAGLAGSLDYQALDCFLARGFVPAPLTFFQEIRKLGPAEILRVRPGEDPIIESYYRPTAHPQISLSKRDRLHGIKTRLIDAVDRRRTASGDVGVLLSSGIDSSLVLASAREIDAKVQAFTFNYTDYSGPFNEGTQARALANHFAVPHHLLECGPRDIIDRLPSLAASYGEPLTYGLHSVMLGGLRDHGISVALTGVGSDCFGISDSGFASIAFHRLPRALRALTRELIAAAKNSAPELTQRAAAQVWSDRNALPSCLHPVLMSDELRLAFFRNSSEARSANSRTLELLHRIADAFSRESPIAAWRFGGQRCFASEGALFWNQIWSRAADVELRHPFYDNTLQEFVMRIGTLGRGKVYIREVAAEMLPEWAARSPKLHHTIPIGHWFRGPLRELLEDHLSAAVLRDHFDPVLIQRFKEEHLSGRVDHAWRIWALVSFVAWHNHVLKPASKAAGELPIESTLVSPANESALQPVAQVIA